MGHPLRQRPHFEAGAALGAAGFAIPAQPIRRRLVLDATARYALYRDPANTASRPQIFNTLKDLARGIHRKRGAVGLEYEEREIDVRRDSGVETVQGVSLWLQDPASETRAAYLGWAFLDGQGQAALVAALQAVQPVRPILEGRAAA